MLFLSKCNAQDKSLFFYYGRVIFLAYVMQVGQLRLPIINAQGKIDVCHFGVTMCKSMLL